jgi:cytochrome P450
VRPAISRGVPFVGDIVAFLSDRLAFVDACARRGDAVTVRFGPRRALVVSHPDLIRQVMILEPKHFVRGISGAVMRPIVGEGLLLSEGEIWRRQRRDVQPIFGTDRVASWIPDIASATRALLSRWHDGDERDILAEMHRVTLDVAGRLFLELAADDRGELHPVLASIVEHDLFRAPIPLGPLARFAGSDARRRPIDDLIHERIAEARAGRVGSLVGALVRTGASDREIRDQIVTLIVTAEDTTASALTWILYSLARDERVERGVREEMAAAPAARPYLAAVLNETLRLYPPVIGEARETVAECEVGGVRVRPGDLVLFSQWVVHRDERWFDRPADFAPDRWSDGLEDRLHPFAYFPFGGGRRVCVGRTLATTIALTALPAILQRFRLSTVHDRRPEIQAVVTLRPRGGLPMRLHALN